MKGLLIKTSIFIDVIIMIVSFAYIETYVWIPFIICVISMAYLAFVLYANGIIMGD